MPNVEKIMLKAVDPTTADEIRILTAKLSGKILDVLAQNQIASNYEQQFMNFLKEALKDKNGEVKT